MQKNILAFGASNSINSINKTLAYYAASQVQGAELNLVDLNDFEMPIYGIDKEKQFGVPNLAKAFKDQIIKADGIIISFAEHNSTYSAVYKNIFDWVSRIEKDVWSQKAMFLMSTSPGSRGGANVLEQAIKSYSRSNKNVISHFSLPSFNENFDSKIGITLPELQQEFTAQLHTFVNAL